MDTQTVLDIIKMIDARIDYLVEEHSEGNMSDDEFYGRKSELSGLSADLQEYIEGQLNAAENSTPE